MRDRSLGVTVLAFGSVMIGLYCQFAAIALLFAGSVYSVTGTTSAAISLTLGAVFLGLTFASYLVGFGLWTRKHWSWAGSIAVLAVLVGTSLALSLVTSSFISSIMPLVAAAAGLWYLNRPAIKAELLRRPIAAKAPTPVSDGLEVVEPAL